MTKPALGAEYREPYHEAFSEVLGGNRERGIEMLEPVLDFCLEKYRSTDARYVAFSSENEFNTFGAAHTGDVPLVWLDRVCADSTMLLGFVLVAEGFPDEALQMLSISTEIGPYLAMTYCEKGHVLIELQRYDDARKAYEKALQLSNDHEEQRPVKPAALRGLGFTLIELGRLDEAERAYEESLMLDPDSELAKCQLLYIEKLRSGDAESAAAPTDSCPP
jgi:tetratricopeptide (TPR) repeat protein